MNKRLMALLSVALWTMGVFAGEPKMLKVDMTVQENGQPTEIQLNFPINMIESMAPQVTEAITQLNSEEVNGINLRQLWAQVRAAGPNEYVNVQHAEGHVRVTTDETHLTVVVDTTEDGNLVAKLPLELGDLLFGENSGAEVSELVAALEQWEGDLITVTGTKANGRVWIE